MCWQEHGIRRTRVSQLLSPRWTATSCCCRLFAASCYSHLLCGRLADLSVHYGDVRCELSPVQRSRVIKWLRKRRALPPTRTATLALWPGSPLTSCLPTTAPLRVPRHRPLPTQQFQIIKPSAQLFTLKYGNLFYLHFRYIYRIIYNGEKNVD